MLLIFFLLEEHSKGTSKALEHLRHSGTRRTLEHSNTQALEALYLADSFVCDIPDMIIKVTPSSLLCLVEELFQNFIFKIYLQNIISFLLENGMLH